MLQINVKKREKKYLEELIKPLNVKYDDIQIDFKETKKQIKHYFMTTIGISLTLTGLILGTYLSTNTRIDNTYNLILEQDKKYNQIIIEFNKKFEKQQEFNYDLLNKIDDNQVSIEQLYNLHK